MRRTIGILEQIIRRITIFGVMNLARQLFTQLNAPLIKGVDIPYHTLYENLVLANKPHS